MEVKTVAERLFTVVLQMFGVFMFTSVSGSLASVLANVDS